jgi:hypothetical protein
MPECLDDHEQHERTCGLPRFHGNARLKQIPVELSSNGNFNNSISYLVWLGVNRMSTVETAVLEDFYPFSIDTAPLPNGVPPDIQAEFREAERCASFGANRAASALFRSVLEKTLKANGYTKSSDPSLRDLQKRIDAASADGVITDARRKRAHEDIRSLGNDVLHDDWREITDEEVESSHRYTQRILEDLYDDRITVEAILVAKKRIPVSP